MSDRRSVFEAALKSYFQTFFTARTTALQIEDIKQWQGTYPELISGMSYFPACQIYINSRQLVSGYVTEYAVTLRIGLINNDPDTLYTLGSKWEDILEDAIRSDWTLGGSCIMVKDSTRIDPFYDGDFYGIGMDFTCEVDCGGFIYANTDPEETNNTEETDGTEDDLSEVQEDIGGSDN